MLLEHERTYDLGMDAAVSVCSWNTNGLWFGHGCCSERMLLEQNYGLGMGAAVSVCSWNTNGLWFGHGCCSERMLLKHEQNYGLGMDAADRSWQHYITEALSRGGRAEFAA